jgi:hypothetical protein
LGGRNRQIDQKRGGSFAAERLVKPNNPSLARNELMAALFPNFQKDRAEQRVLEFLRDDRSDDAGVAPGDAQPFKVAGSDSKP